MVNILLLIVVSHLLAIIYTLDHVERDRLRDRKMFTMYLTPSGPYVWNIRPIMRLNTMCVMQGCLYLTALVLIMYVTSTVDLIFFR